MLSNRFWFFYDTRIIRINTRLRKIKKHPPYRLKSKGKNMKLYKLESKLNFGKYKGKTVKEIQDTDPSYIEWAKKNVSWFKIEENQTKKETESSMKIHITVNLQPKTKKSWMESIIQAISIFKTLLKMFL